MTQSPPRPPVWRMVKEGIETLGPKTTSVALRNWVLNRYPGTNQNTVQCQIIICTVNHLSRIHYPENKKPRIADGQYDFLFRPVSGEIERYDPALHGRWEIAAKEDGGLCVRSVGENIPIEDEMPVPLLSGACFAAENHLRDFLEVNLSVIEDGLQLYAHEDGRAGVEFNTDIGRIDLLAVDRDGGFLVIELKVDRGPDQVCGQIMRYVGWVKRHIAQGRTVRGLIIARHISDRIQYALADVPNVTAREYQLHITLKPAHPL